MIPVWWSLLLTVLGGLGWLLVTLDRRLAGFLLGCTAQLAWTAYAIATGQLPFLASAALFGAINVLGLMRLRRPAATVTPEAAWDNGCQHGLRVAHEMAQRFPKPWITMGEERGWDRCREDMVAALGELRADLDLPDRTPA